MNDSKLPPDQSSPYEGPAETPSAVAESVPTAPPVAGTQLPPASGSVPAASGGSGSPPVRRDDSSDEVEDPEERELGGRMTFLEHLDELRRRILYSLAAVLVAFVGAWAFREEIYGFLSAPIKQVVERLVVITPTEPFTIYLKVSFAAAIFFAVPFLLLQVWLFVAPGLYRREKRFALPFLISSTILFVLGGAFAYYVVLPPALTFLLKEFGREFQPMITAMEFFDFALLILVGMGAIFQLPVLVAFLSIFGLVTPGFLWRNFRYAFLLITIIAALVSPTTDPFNLFLWSGPMVILYTISIGISWIFKRRRAREGRE
jgi:sec-independent protein translocase protein TatC